jgi:hypothetical protein
MFNSDDKSGIPSYRSARDSVDSMTDPRAGHTAIANLEAQNAFAAYGPETYIHARRAIT